MPGGNKNNKLGQQHWYIPDTNKHTWSDPYPPPLQATYSEDPGRVCVWGRGGYLQVRVSKDSARDIAKVFDLLFWCRRCR